MGQSEELLCRIREQIDEIPVIDVHTHMRAENPSADHLADVALYHHLGTELMSAGMPPQAVSTSGLPHELVDPGIAPLDRVRSALPYLKRIRNTMAGCFLREIVRDLYGVEEGELNEATFDKAAEAAAGRAADPDWAETLLREKCRIAHSVTVEGVGRGNGASGFSFVSEAVNSLTLKDKGGDQKRAFRTLEDRAGADIGRREALNELVRKTVQNALDVGVLAIAIWPPPDLVWRDGADSDLVSAAANMRASGGSAGDRDVFVTAVMKCALDLVRESGLGRVQIFLGAEVKLPHRSISAGSGEFGRELCKMFGDYEEIRFDVTTAADIHSQDTAIIAKHFPNVSVMGYWWHTLYPHYVRKLIDVRLDTVPSNKITAFFSDAYHAEWCYPKLRMVRRILAEALAARVEDGRYTEDYALELARQVLYDNPKTFYGID